MGPAKSEGSITVTVARLSGEVIFRREEVGVYEEVRILMDRVAGALSGTERMSRMVANGRLLHANAYIKQSGLVDGDTITAIIQPKPVPKVLKNRFGATAELRDDGSVVVHGNPIMGG